MTTIVTAAFSGDRTALRHRIAQEA